MAGKVTFGRPREKSDDPLGLILRNLAGICGRWFLHGLIGHSFVLHSFMLHVLSLQRLTLIGFGLAAGNRQIDRSTDG